MTKVGEQLQALDPDAADPDGLITSARTELAAEQQAAKLAADYHTALRLFDAGRWEEAIDGFERITRLDATYKDAPALLDRARREQDQAAFALAEEQARPEAEEQAIQQRAEERARAGEQRDPTQHEKTLPKLYEPVQQGRMNEERSKHVRRPQQESRKDRRLASRVALVMLGLLVVVTIGVAGWYLQSETDSTQNSASEEYDKLLSHLPASERSTCESTDISAEQLAAAVCSAGTYGLWNNTDDAKLDYDREKGTCTRAVPNVGTYQHWAEPGRSGILSCYLTTLGGHYAERWTVEWSIDQLNITGKFYDDSDYWKALGEALRIRDQVK